MNKLTIFWNEKYNDSFYWLLDKNNSIQSESTVQHDLEQNEILKADLACLADTASGKRVELVLSNTDIHFGQVNLPNKAQRHLRKAVPYLLEEQLADNIDSVFIAIGERLNSGETPVRVIQREYLQQILQAFKQAEIKLDSVRVDLDLLESPEEGYLLTLKDEQLLTSESDGARWSCDKDDFAWLVQKKISQSQNSQKESDSQASDEDLAVAQLMQVIVDSDESYQWFENQLPAGIFAPRSQVVESIPQYLAQSHQPEFNLLQAEFEPKIENSPLKKMLKKLATLAAIILVAHIFYQGSQLFTLDNKLTLLTQERNALRKQGFPNRKRVTEKTLSIHMKTVGGGSGESSFLAMLQSTSEKVKDLQSLYPTNISYDSARNELRMDLIAKDLPTLNQYRDDLKQSGHQVDMSSATQRGEGYSSRLIIRK